VQKLLSGKAETATPAGVHKRLQKNAEVEHVLTQLDRDIALLREEEAKCAATIADKHAAAERAYREVLSRLGDLLTARLRTGIQKLIAENLEPLRDIEVDLRAHGVENARLSDRAGRFDVAWYDEEGRFVAPWPPSSPRGGAGVVEELIQGYR
jgi:hypothetical protein